MTRPAAEVFRVERDSGTTPMGRRHRGARALGTAMTGLPMPAPRVRFETTLRILDQTDAVLYETTGDSTSMDALELEILQDLMRLDEDAFRRAYGLAEREPL